MALSTFLWDCDVDALMVILVTSHIEINAQARKQNGDHCDVIYDIIIA